jgi:hypothetical protein
LRSVGDIERLHHLCRRYPDDELPRQVRLAVRERQWGSRSSIARIRSYPSASSRAPFDGGWTWKGTGPLATSVARTRTSPGHDYEYDEAHDVPAGQLGVTPPPHRVDPPEVKIGVGGHYGYDEAISAPPEQPTPDTAWGSAGSRALAQSSPFACASGALGAGSLPAMRQTFGTKRPSTAVHPPSTNCRVPVTNVDASDARNRIAPTISSGVAQRFSAVLSA